MAARSRTSEVDEGKDLLRTALGTVLRERRKRVPKLSQMSLAIKAGLPANAVGDLERGVRTIKEDELIRLCIELDIPTEAFLAEVSSAQVRALRPLDQKLRGIPGGAAGQKSVDLREGGGAMSGQARSSSDLVFFSVGIARPGGDLTEMFIALTQRMKQDVAALLRPSEEEEPQGKA